MPGDPPRRTANSTNQASDGDDCAISIKEHSFDARMGVSPKDSAGDEVIEARRKLPRLAPPPSSRADSADEEICEIPADTFVRKAIPTRYEAIVGPASEAPSQSRRKRFFPTTDDRAPLSTIGDEDGPILELIADWVASRPTASEVRTLLNQRGKTLSVLSVAPPALTLSHSMSFSDLLRFAELADRWLLVSFQLPSSLPCVAANRDVWRDTETMLLVSEHCVFAQLTLGLHPAAEAFVRRYNLRPLTPVPGDLPVHAPFAALLHPSTGAAMFSWSGIDAPSIGIAGADPSRSAPLLSAAHVTATLRSWLAQHQSPSRFKSSSQRTVSGSAAPVLRSPPASTLVTPSSPAPAPASAPGSVSAPAARMAAANSSSLSMPSYAPGAFAPQPLSGPTPSLTALSLSALSIKPVFSGPPYVPPTWLVTLTQSASATATGSHAQTRLQLLLPSGARSVRTLPTSLPVCALYHWCELDMRVQPNAAVRTPFSTASTPVAGASGASFSADDTYSSEPLAPFTLWTRVAPRQQLPRPVEDVNGEACCSGAAGSADLKCTVGHPTLATFGLSNCVVVAEED